MSWFEAIVLGVLQGLTEYLPVSSTAHLLIAGKVAGWGDPSAAFTAVTQLGTVAAVLVYFRGELVHIVKGLFTVLRTRNLSDPEGRMAWLLAIGSVPILVLGFLAKDVVEGSARNLYVVAAALIVVGGVLAYADLRGKGRLQLHDLTMRFALILGFGQALALIPGVSRSGATIAVALLLGFNRVAATRFSFLLAIPAVLVSGLYELRKVGDGSLSVGPTLAATAISFVVGLACIHWLLKFVATHTFRWFVVYRVLLGLTVLGLLAANVVTAT
jgi:undecaprenyl-diphosphatase